MNPRTKQRTIMAVATAGFCLTGFQFFVIGLMQGWRFFAAEAAIATAIGGLMGWAAFPKTGGKCIKIGVITGLILGYALIILSGKKV